ncbi:MAG: hypothetical protein AB7V43_21110 [Acidimicrobiia bacterium]
MSDDPSFDATVAEDAAPGDAAPGDVVRGDEVVELTIPHDVSYIRVARLAVSGIAALCGFDIDAIDDLRLAVDELCVCCVECGRGPIAIRFAWDGAALHVSGSSSTGPDTATLIDDRRFDLTHQVVLAAVGAHLLFVDGDSVHFSFSRQR